MAIMENSGGLLQRSHTAARRSSGPLLAGYSTRRLVLLGLYLCAIVLSFSALSRMGFNQRDTHWLIGADPTAARLEYNEVQKLAIQAMLANDHGDKFQLVMVAPLLPLNDATLQRQVRAIHSWTQLMPPPLIYLACEDPQDFDVISSHLYAIGNVDPQRVFLFRLDVTWHSFVDANLGNVRLPTISSIIQRVLEKRQGAARPAVYAYVNSDITLFAEFARAAYFAARSGSFSRYLMVGERTELMVDKDMAISAELRAKEEARDRRGERPPVPDYNAPNALLNASFYSQLRAATETRGHLRGRWAIDYFVFGPDTWPRAGENDPARVASGKLGGPGSGVPDFVIGRPRFDNWLVANARGVRVEAVTPAVLAMHPVHDYTHAGASVSEIRADFKSPIIEENNPGRDYNEKVLAAVKNKSVFYRLGSLDHYCTKMHISASRGFCLHWDGEFKECRKVDKELLDVLFERDPSLICGRLFG